MKRLILIMAAAALCLQTTAQNARSLVYVYLDGGSSQTDTFDPKPEAGNSYVGKYKTPVETAVKGVYIGEKLVKLAAIADKFTILRGMTDRTNAHETGHYRMLTGDMTGKDIVYPSYGAVIACKKQAEYDNPIFPYICVTEASTRFNEAGFLNVMFKPYDTEGKPDGQYFDVSGIVNHNIPDELLKSRRELLQTLSLLGRPVEQSSEVKKAAELREKSYELMLGKTREVFNLRSVSDSLRQAYGRNNFGQSCLVASRLVEAGVQVVMVRFRGWDTHKEHFKRMDQRLAELDGGVSSLILDLESKDLLDKTIIVVGGEFGRTPKIDFAPPWNGGRGHYGAAFSYIVAGGGFIPGKVVGSTDAHGEKVLDREVYPADLWASVYKLMGIDPEGTLTHPVYGEIPMLPSYGQKGQSNGMLVEIMKSL